MTSEPIERLCATADEAAASLRISKSRVYDLMRTNELASIKLGRSRLIPIAELRRFVADQQRAPVTA